MEIYKSEKAPFYNLDNINVKLSIFYGSEDRLATYQDIKRLIGELRNCEDIYFRIIKAGHTSFMWGKDMSYFKDILRLLEVNK